MPAERFGPYYLMEPLLRGNTEHRCGRLASDPPVSATLLDMELLLPTREATALYRHYLKENQARKALFHSALPAIQDLGIEDSRAYVAYEYVPGRSLEEILRALAQPFPLPIALAIAHHIGSGLAKAHEAPGAANKPQPIVHGKLSPQWIWIGQKGEVHIRGFGLHELLRVDGPVLSSIKELSHSAPEQIEAKPATIASDVFLLGALLWEMATSRPLFSADDMETLRSQARSAARPKATELNPELPASIENFFSVALATDPAKRFRTMAEAIAALEKIAAIPPAEDAAIALLSEAFPNFAQEASAFEARQRGLKELPPRETEAPSLATLNDVPVSQSSAELQGRLLEEQSGDSGLGVGTRTVSAPTEKRSAPEPPRPRAAQAPTPEEILALSAAHSSQAFPWRHLLLAVVAVGCAVSYQWNNKISQGVAELTASVARPLGMIAAKDPGANESLGEIQLKTEESGYLVKMDGHPIPVVGNRILVPYNTRLRLQVSKFGFEDINLVAQAVEGMATPVLPLEFKPERTKGGLTVTTGAEAEVVVRQGAVEFARQPAPIQRLVLPIGTYEVEVHNQLLGHHETFLVELPPGKVVTFHRDLHPKR